MPSGDAIGVSATEAGASAPTSLRSSGARLLSRVVATYQGQAPIFRVAEKALEELLRKHESVTAIVVFPQFSPEEILALAPTDAKLPTGITRFVIPQRVLRVDLPLEILGSSTPREVKNARLEAYIRERLRRGKVRAYQESVILFDD